MRLLKNIFTLFFFLLFAAQVSAQTTAEALPPYRKDLRIPDFSILQTDSSYFTRAQLPVYDYTAFIYFQPDCSHCQYEASEIVKNMDSLKNVFFIFAAYKTLPEIKDFAEKFGLHKFSNIRTGRDPLYHIPAFFEVRVTPFVALYDRSGMFVKAWEKGVEAPELIALVKKN